MKVFSEKKYLEFMKEYGYSEKDLEGKDWTWYKGLGTWYKGLDKKPVDSLPFIIIENWTEEE